MSIAGPLERAKQMLRLPLREWRTMRPSFSQYGEDLALVRLLNPTTRGTYVDVGANDPMDGSNSAFLYFLGWSGLAVDANPAFERRFRKLRPRDIYLTAGVSDKIMSLTYYLFANDKFNTLSPERVKQLAKDDIHPVEERSISCLPLYDMVKRELGDKHIDLLSVDCEGLDLEVLRSAKLDLLQPTVVLIEDFAQYCGFRDNGDRGPVDAYLRSQRYSPIWQAAWSTIYVANHWRDLPKGAFDPPSGATDYMPS